MQARSRVTVEAILEAGARLFDRGSATTNAIAELAGVSIGSLYEYFPNKEAILHSLVEEHVREAEDALRQVIAEHDPQQVELALGVRALVQAMLALHDDRPGLHQRFVRGFMGQPAVRERIVAAEKRLREEIAAWLRAHPQVKARDVELSTRMIVEGTNALVHRYVEDDEGRPRSSFVDELVRLWVGHLQQP